MVKRSQVTGMGGGGGRVRSLVWGKGQEAGGF